MVNRKTDNTMAKRKSRNKDLQNNTQKTENQATYTPLKTGSELGCTGNVKKIEHRNLNSCLLWLKIAILLYHQCGIDLI